jgi:DNA-binding SARP family transcriptional activator
MAPAFETEDRTLTGYGQVLMHLKHAQAAADQIGDKAAVGLIEMLQRLCLTRAGINSEPMTQNESPGQGQGPTSSLCVHLFGAFQAFLNGIPINGWRKKSEAVFKYLIVHRTAPVHREKLFELFWSDQEPQLARNCLNVTMHALRQSLRPNGALQITDSPIQFANDHYYLHPHLSVWTDTEAFTNYTTLAQIALKQSNHTEALTYYEMAAALYRGHFLENDLYEEWTIHHRERLKGTYISMLAQQSQLFFENRDYSTALDYCRKILECDNCDEEAHCQVMRCYYALGRRGLALRQYQVLCDTLFRGLGLRPMDETTSLYEQVKNGNLR